MTEENEKRLERSENNKDILDSGEETESQRKPETPPEEEEDGIIEVVLTGEEKEEPYALDLLNPDKAVDRYLDEVAQYTSDEDVLTEFRERQQLNQGSAELEKSLRVHHSKSPELTGGDLDANWEQAGTVGDEAVGGLAPTPDQDVVDELGKAVGLTYADDEPLNIQEKLEERDRHRWELNPESVHETEEEEDNNNNQE